MGHEQHDDRNPLTVRGLLYAIDYAFERLEGLQVLHTINRKLDLIMVSVADLNKQIADQGQQIVELQGSLDTEQEQIRAAIDAITATNTSLMATVDQLNAIIAAGATPEQLQAISDALTTNSTALVAVKADLEGTIADAQPEG